MNWWLFLFLRKLPKIDIRAISPRFATSKILVDFDVYVNAIVQLLNNKVSNRRARWPEAGCSWS